MLLDRFDAHAAGRQPGAPRTWNTHCHINAHRFEHILPCHVPPSLLHLTLLLLNACCPHCYWTAIRHSHLGPPLRHPIPFVPNFNTQTFLLPVLAYQHLMYMPNHACACWHHSYIISTPSRTGQPTWQHTSYKPSIPEPCAASECQLLSSIPVFHVFLPFGNN